VRSEVCHAHDLLGVLRLSAGPRDAPP